VFRAFEAGTLPPGLDADGPAAERALLKLLARWRSGAVAVPKRPLALTGARG
jgi:hypothetical protein